MRMAQNPSQKWFVYMFVLCVCVYFCFANRVICSIFGNLTGRPGVLRFMGSQRVGHNWVTELNWTELICLSMRPQNQNPSGLLPINVFKHMLWRKNWFRSSKFYCSFDLWVSLCLSFYFLIHCRLLIKSCLECMLILCSKLSLGRVHS